MTDVRLRRRTHRLIPTRYPSVGILDRVASPADLEAVFELEAWTNDRISNELGILLRLPREEWVVGTPMASVVMAAFCHPRPGGSRFNGEDRGAWYASFSLDTAHAEAAFHRGRELADVGITDARLQMRDYVATVSGVFTDIRADRREHRGLHDPDRYEESQRFARTLLDGGANGIVYRSVRHEGGTCVACFRPALVRDVSIGGHYEYRWEGRPTPSIRRVNGG
ncbi:MAG: RES family NAD+ phosphorylase [Vicinamibacterales bacterium]